MEELALNSPEIEAKFLIPSKDVYRSMKSLVGTRINLMDMNGRPIEYLVEMDKRHIYEDVNYDTRDLSLFRKRGMLRERVRYDRKPGDDDYKFKKAVFQAKNGPIDNQGMTTAVYARSEIRGQEFSKLGKFKDQRKRLLDGRVADDAIAFAREYSESQEPFIPVLSIKSKRFFMRLRKVGAPSNVIPWFYVSLDDVKYEGLIGEKSKSRRLELEAEMNDDLAQDSPEVSRQKLFLMDRLSEYLQSAFGLVPSPESKYESGMRFTVLPN